MYAARQWACKLAAAAAANSATCAPSQRACPSRLIAAAAQVRAQASFTTAMCNTCFTKQDGCRQGAGRKHRCSGTQPLCSNYAGTTGRACAAVFSNRPFRLTWGPALPCTAPSQRNHIHKTALICAANTHLSCSSTAESMGERGIAQRCTS